MKIKLWVKKIIYPTSIFGQILECVWLENKKKNSWKFRLASLDTKWTYIVSIYKHTSLMSECKEEESLLNKSVFASN